MYEGIAKELTSILGSNKTAGQYEACVRTVLWREKGAIDNNRTSGATWCCIPYEEGLEALRVNEDSVQLQVIWNAEQVWPQVAATTTSSSQSLDDAEGSRPVVRSTSLDPVDFPEQCGSSHQYAKYSWECHVKALPIPSVWQTMNVENASLLRQDGWN